MADSIVRLKVDSSEFDSKVKRASQGIQALEQHVHQMGATFEVAEKEDLAFVKSLGQMETVATSAKGKLKEYTAAILDLTSTYNKLSSSEKSSEFGKALASSIDQLKQKAGGMKDQITDLNQELGHIASDTKFTDGLNMMTQTVGALGSAMVALGGNGDNVKEMIAELAKIQTVVGAVDALTKAFQKQNLVLLENPAVAATAAIVALGVACAELAKKQKEAAAKANEMNNLMKQGQMDAQAEVSKIQLLSQKLHDNSLSIAERSQALASLRTIVPEYHASLTEEGKLINDNSSALSAYANNLIAVAQAQAAFGAVVDKQRKLLENASKLESLSNQKWSLDQQITAAESNSALGMAMQASTGNLYARRSQVEGEIKALYSENQQLNREIADLSKKVSTSYLTGASRGTSSGRSSSSRVSTGSSSRPSSSSSASSSARVSSAVADTNNIILAEEGLNFELFDSINKLKTIKKYWEEVFEQSDGRGAKKVKAIIDEIDQKIKNIESGDIYKIVGIDKIRMDEMDFTGVAEALNVKSNLPELGRQTQQAWRGAVGAVSQVAGALQGVNDKSVNIAAIVAQAIANIALAYGNALAGDQVTKSNIFAFLGAAAASVISMVTAISQVHSATGYEQGGIIPGNSYSGDHVPAMVNSGELILNRAQQNNLASALTERPMYGGGRSTISGEQIVTVINAYGKRTHKGEILK